LLILDIYGITKISLSGKQDPATSFRPAEAFHIPALLFSGPPQFAEPLSGMKTGSLKLQSFHFLGWRNVEIVLDRLIELDSMMQKSGDLDPPALGLCLHFVFIADMNLFAGFGSASLEFDLSSFATIRCDGPGLEKSNGPEVFVKPEFLFFSHMD
jgi:hypothetical protein